MHFALSDEQRQLAEVAEGALRRAAPMSTVREALETGSLHEAGGRALRELGLVAAMIPCEAGGPGLGLLEAALVAERCGEAALPFPYADQVVAGLLLDGMPASCDGVEGPTALVLAEETGGWSPSSWTCAGHGGLVGRKVRVPYAHASHRLLVGLAGGGAGLVASDAAGMTIRHRATGGMFEPECDVEFDGTPFIRLELPPGRMAAVRTAALVLDAADALGAATALFARTVAHLEERRQFGRPLADFQAIRHQLADIAAELESSRSLVWYAAARFDEHDTGAGRTALLAKAHVCAVAVEAARRCIVLHGAIGFAWEADAQILLKRTMSRLDRLGGPRALRLEAAAMGRPGSAAEGAAD